MFKLTIVSANISDANRRAVCPSIDECSKLTPALNEQKSK